MHQVMTFGGIVCALGGVAAVLLGLAGVACLDPGALKGMGGNSAVLIGGGVGLIIGVPALLIGLRLWADSEAAKERLV